MSKKTALVTGGTSGIGGKVTQQLANLGAKVLFIGNKYFYNGKTINILDIVAMVNCILGTGDCGSGRVVSSNSNDASFASIVSAGILLFTSITSRLES